MANYEFTADWFSGHEEIWLTALPASNRQAKKILEIGSYEGRSSVWLLQTALHPDGGELFCIDTWEGSLEHRWSEMASVEKRFDENTGIALSNLTKACLIKLKGTSRSWIPSLLTQGHADSFDLIYVDGSHQAPDVLEDLVGAFRLCKVGGAIVCDDYLWDYGQNPLLTPKLAIDAFTNCFATKLSILPAPLRQMFMIKRSS